jgi:AAHS family 4-hydroxybenzoate transporter-like MFS transporter
MRQPDTIDIGSVIETQASSWYSHLVVILCCVAMVIEGYDAQVLAYAAPAIIRDWNIEQSYSGRSSVRPCSATCLARRCSLV